MLYTDALAGAFAWQWLGVWEDAKSACSQGTVEAPVGGFRSRTAASQLGIGLLLRVGSKGTLVSWRSLHTDVKVLDRRAPLV